MHLVQRLELLALTEGLFSGDRDVRGLAGATAAGFCGRDESERGRVGVRTQTRRKGTEAGMRAQRTMYHNGRVGEDRTVTFLAWKAEEGERGEGVSEPRRKERGGGKRTNQRREGGRKETRHVLRKRYVQVDA